MKSWPPDILSRLHLYRLAEDDLDDLMAIERVSFAQPWSRELMAVELKGEHNIRLGARWGGRQGFMAGYIFLWLVLDEAQLHTIASHPALRGQSIAVCLLATSLEMAWRKGATWCSLEVRPSNWAARRLYDKFAFKQVGIRKAYYNTPSEDALLLNADIDRALLNLDDSYSKLTLKC